MNKAVKQPNIEYAVAIIHFLLTFWFERILFHFDGDRDLFVSAARTETISDYLALVETALCHDIQKNFPGDDDCVCGNLRLRGNHRTDLVSRYNWHRD